MSYKRLILFLLMHFPVLIILFINVTCLENSLNPSDPENPFDNITVRRYGSERSLDVATWNIQLFPKSDERTVAALSKIIRQIDIDIIAIQEINQTTAFEILLDSLPGYAGCVSKFPLNGLRLGILYKKQDISLSKPVQIFVEDNWNFPRPPMLTLVTVYNLGKIVFDFVLVVVHLKAFDDDQSQIRRHDACRKLKEYIDSKLLTSSEKDIVLLGDFNDEVIDPAGKNIFQPFIEDSLHYQILTRSLKQIPTYIGDIRSHLDHILITDDVRKEYAQGITEVLQIDQEYPLYIEYISDHRPVLARFFIFD